VAALHIRAWQVAYRGQIPDAYLASLGTLRRQRSEMWRRWIEGMSSLADGVLVAQVSEDVRGFCAYGPSRDDAVDGTVGEIDSIYVDPDHWGRGAGRALLRKATELLAVAGFREATLWVLDTNDRARHFYDAAGWRPDGGAKGKERGGAQLRELRYRLALASSARMSTQDREGPP